MILNFTISNKIEYETKLDLQLNEILPNYISHKNKNKNNTNSNSNNLNNIKIQKTQNTTFKIPLNVKN